MPRRQANLATLRARGYEIVDPERGFLAERELGVGRLAAEERILDALERSLARRQALRGKRVAITAGPTREAFDPIRFLSNASSGAMGIELAREAALRGARVTLMLGPTLLEPPAGVDVVRVTTAAELYDAALAHAAGADLTIATAAVADWRPAERSESKVKKTGGDLTVRLDSAIPMFSRSSGGARARGSSWASRPRRTITRNEHAKSCARSTSTRSPSTTYPENAASASARTRWCCFGATTAGGNWAERTRRRWRRACSMPWRS